MKYGTTTVALLTLVVAAACSSDLNQPLSPDGISGANNQSIARSGVLHVEADCSNYLGRAGDTCTIVKSNLKEFEVGSVVYHLQAPNPDFTISTDVIVDPPEPGNNTAFGHCNVNLLTLTGVCVLSGGTGKFTLFNASIDVTPVSGGVAWDGTYSYGP